MIDFWEVLERCEKGERMKVDDYDLFLWENVSEITKKYDIFFDRNHVVPDDDGLADRAYEAAFELFLRVGFYCLDTERVARFTREEVEDVLRNAPSQYVWGEGKDQRMSQARQIEDRRDPSCTFSALGVPVPEDLLVKVCQSLAMEPLADSFCGPSLLSTFRGIRIKAGHPIEVAAAIWDVAKRREAAKLAGRPGLGIYCLISCAESTAAILAAAREQFGALKTDVTQNGVIAELKVDFARMNKVPFQLESGSGIAGLYGPLMGGYAGGPEGTMVTLIAHFFLGLLAFRADYHIPFPIDIHQVCNTSAEMLWLVSVYSQAIAKNTHLLNLSVAMAAAGPATEMLFYEMAAHAMTSTVSGANLVLGGIARDKHPERTSSLEIRAGAEVGHIVARMGMSRDEVNRMVRELLSRYEEDIPNAPLGKKFSEIYDLERVTPTEEYEELYQRMRKELANLGLNYSLL
jgi:hypothetical protein